MHTIAVLSLLAIQFFAPFYFLIWIDRSHQTPNGTLITQTDLSIYGGIFLTFALALSLAASYLIRLFCVTKKTITPFWIVNISILLGLMVVTMQQAVSPHFSHPRATTEVFLNTLYGIQLVFIFYVLKTPWDILRDLFSEVLDRTAIKVKNRVTRETRDNHA